MSTQQQHPSQPGFVPQYFQPAPPPPPKKTHKVRNVFLAIAGVIAFIIVAALVQGGNDTTDVASPVQASAPAEPSEAPVSKPKEKKAEPSTTVAQEQALSAAQSYVDTLGISKKGLVGQLKFDKFDASDAKWAANHVDANWNDEAAEAGESYLEVTSMSEAGLVDQLEFDKFTRSQAEYGAHYAYTHS
jgi:hypothetical protein